MEEVVIWVISNGKVYQMNNKINKENSNIKWIDLVEEWIQWIDMVDNNKLVIYIEDKLQCIDNYKDKHYLKIKEVYLQQLKV